MSVYKLVCPHCHGKMRIRTSDGEHMFLRKCYLQCTNMACSWSCVAQFEMTHELSPSSVPNPQAMLPIAPSAMRRSVEKCGRKEEQIDLLDHDDREYHNHERTA